MSCFEKKVLLGSMNILIGLFIDDFAIKFNATKPNLGISVLTTEGAAEAPAKTKAYTTTAPFIIQ